MSQPPLFIMLADDSWKRAHHALIVAAGAASLGREVVFFAGGLSVHALAENWSGLRDSITDPELSTKGIAGFGELRKVLQELGCVFMACEAGLKIAELPPELLMKGVEIRGIVSFLERAGAHSILTI